MLALMTLVYMLPHSSHLKFESQGHHILLKLKFQGYRNQYKVYKLKQPNPVSIQNHMDLINASLISKSMSHNLYICEYMYLDVSMLSFISSLLSLLLSFAMSNMWSYPRVPIDLVSYQTIMAGLKLCFDAWNSNRQSIEAQFS